MKKQLPVTDPDFETLFDIVAVEALLPAFGEAMSQPDSPGWWSVEGKYLCAGPAGDIFRTFYWVFTHNDGTLHISLWEENLPLLGPAEEVVGVWRKLNYSPWEAK